jgi:hypothetical protein
MEWFWWYLALYLAVSLLASFVVVCAIIGGARSQRGMRDDYSNEASDEASDTSGAGNEVRHMQAPV